MGKCSVLEESNRYLNKHKKSAAEKIANQLLFISKIPKLCAILQLDLAALNTLFLFTLQKPEISTGFMGH